MYSRHLIPMHHTNDHYITFVSTGVLEKIERCIGSKTCRCNPVNVDMDRGVNSTILI